MTGRPAGSAVPAGLPDDARDRLGALAREHPEWRPWLALVEAVLHEAREPGWELAVPDVLAPAAGPPSREPPGSSCDAVTPERGPREAAGAPERSGEAGAGGLQSRRSTPAARPAGAPLLAGALLVVDPSLAARWVGRLLEHAAGWSSPGAASLAPAASGGRLDPLDLLEAAVCQDEARLDALAATTGADPRALAAVGQLAAMPLLQACGRHLAGLVPAAWRQGYCPVCGAWPALAELRGLESARRLRCGRCGADWGVEWLRCPYCGVTDHRSLGSLVPEE